MKAILEFDFSDPESGDREEFDTMMKATSYQSALSDIFNALRIHIKYGRDPDFADACEKLREEFVGVLEKHEVSI